MTARRLALTTAALVVTCCAALAVVAVAQQEKPKLPEMPDLNKPMDDAKKPLDDAKKQIEDAKKQIQEGVKKPTDDAHPINKGAAPELDEVNKHAAPGREHEFIRAFAGTFRVEIRSSLYGDSVATSVNSMVLGDRFLRQEWSGRIGDQAVTGLGFWGYDKARKKYVATWMDTLSTAIITTEGDFDAGSRTFTNTGEMADHATGKVVKIRQVIKYSNDEEHSIEMFAPGKDGKDASVFKANYTREKR